ncbi:ArsR/SmtB family transcription factor [Enterococcus faecium]|uniref:HTH arsR-type domain-containing protein n=1 Tax=Enterococcus faecium TaxID=1352 RepID=A0A242B064_ENTFC|nr:metalloregulator ArsR/SmtB family transcription factor [Enterococcus faecium]OTN86720.1 hypothetical protein A5810_002960 [Enterococcus faecium]OTN86755.1 hypothetical protein A5809_002854 [Enterococcus faecium]
MAIKIEFSNYSLKTNETLTQRIQFVYSPLNELFRSLHVLLNPRHHGNNIDWIIESQKKLTTSFYEDLDYFRLFYELGVSPILLCNFNYYATSLDEELSNLKSYLPQLPVDQLINQLLKVTIDRENSYIPTLAKGLEWEDFTLQEHPQLLKDLAVNPSVVYQRLFAFIEWYRQEVFNDTWEKKELKKKLLNEIQKQSIFLRKNGPITMFDHLQIDRIHWRNDQLTIVKPFDQKIRLSDNDSIMLLPSYFIWPHLFVESFEKGIAITYDITEQPSYYNDTPENLVAIFKALSDPIRLQIISYVKEKPCTTQSLAQLLLMSNSSISRHLQILKEAKLLTARKDKKFVLYEPTRLITQLMPGFYQFFEK